MPKNISSPEHRSYVVCRNAIGALRLRRAPTHKKPLPNGWQTVETVVGLEGGRARLTVLVAERDAERQRSTEQANITIRRVLGASVFPGVRLRVTEADIAAEGLFGVLSKRLRLSAPQIAYLKWVDAGRPKR